MNSIKQNLIDCLKQALKSLDINVAIGIGLERPARKEHGDWSSNIALAAAKPAGVPPRVLAQKLVESMEPICPSVVKEIQIAGPGFINFYLHDSWLYEVMLEAISLGENNFGRSEIGKSISVNVEFVSANPTGPLHAGGGRWAAFGDSLCNLLQFCGYKVHREYYLNDRGKQMQLFAQSLAAKKAGKEVDSNGYQGEYITEWAAEMPDDADPALWGYDRVLKDLRETLAKMGVYFDTWYSENSLIESGAIDQTLEKLSSRGVVYELDGATWLRTTAFDDDKDRVIIRSDGQPTYVLPDIAYHRDKFQRGFDLLIDIWGSDHHGYVTRLKAGVAALGYDPNCLEVILGQLVTLVKNGQPVRLSKRTGDMVALSDVLDAVGPDAARLTFLLQSIDTRLVFDLDVVSSNTMENPVYYIQYAYARVASIAKVAKERGIVQLSPQEVDFSLLVHEREKDLLRALSELPETILLACNERAPYKITNWVRDFAGRFHGFYHDCYVMGEGISPQLTQARLYLVEAVRIGLNIGLKILGVSAPEEM